MANPILLNVDDHEVARYARTRILTNAGFTVHEAASGRQTLEMVARHKPDLILLDVHLPDISGFEVCRLLRQQMTEDSFIILQITASATSPTHATTALDGGADAYITEPVDAEVLVATIRAMLRLHQAERALAHANRQLAITNQELMRSNSDLSYFAFAASHDLQEPLRTISIFTRLVHRSVAGRLNETENAHFERIISSAARMGLLISDLLAYSQVGREAIQRNVIELREVAAWAIKNLKVAIEESGAIIEIDPDLPAVLGDFSLLVQVFQNLISNALKYRDGSVTAVVNVRSERLSVAQVKVSVSDNGPGISPQHYEKLFVPFKRIHGAEVAGSGIGLALCRRIIEAHGGRIWVEPDVRQGSTFSFTLATS